MGHNLKQLFGNASRLVFFSKGFSPGSSPGDTGGGSDAGCWGPHWVFGALEMCAAKSDGDGFVPLLVPKVLVLAWFWHF